MELLKTLLLTVSKMYQIYVAPILANIWNEEILLHKNFPENLKLADVSPVFKKNIKLFLKITDQ